MLPLLSYLDDMPVLYSPILHYRHGIFLITVPNIEVRCWSDPLSKFWSRNKKIYVHVYTCKPHFSVKKVGYILGITVLNFFIWGGILSVLLLEISFYGSAIAEP